MSASWTVFVVCAGAALVISLLCSLGILRLGRYSRFAKSHPIEAAFVAVVASSFIAFGSTKPPPGPAHLWRFEFTNGVHDAGSVCVGDEIRASWSCDIPVLAHTLKAFYQDLTVTNSLGECVDALHELDSVPVADFSHTWTVTDAERMRVVLYAVYVAPPVVHTNGVYHLNGVMRAMDDSDRFVTPGVPIRVALPDGSALIITPTNPATVH